MAIIAAVVAQLVAPEATSVHVVMVMLCDDGHVCPECDEQVCDNSQAMLCDRCGKWCHIHCGKMEKSTYKSLRGIIDDKLLYWYCGGCNVVIIGISHDLEAAQLEDLIIKQNTRITELENTVVGNG